MARALPDDAQLVERCLAGDASAWAAIVRTHARRIYNLCFRFTGRAADAEDLSQEVFLRVYRALPGFRPDQGSLPAWMTALCRNLLIDHYRRTQQDRQTGSLDDAAHPVQEPASAAPAAEDGVWRREVNELVQAALLELSPELREAVILRDLQDLDYKEIAAVLHIPEGTVKSRINRGRIEMAHLLDPALRRARAGRGGSR